MYADYDDEEEQWRRQQQLQNGRHGAEGQGELFDEGDERGYEREGPTEGDFETQEGPDGQHAYADYDDAEEQWRRQQQLQNGRHGAEGQGELFDEGDERGYEREGPFEDFDEGGLWAYEEQGGQYGRSASVGGGGSAGDVRSVGSADTGGAGGRAWRHAAEREASSVGCVRGPRRTDACVRASAAQLASHTPCAVR